MEKDIKKILQWIKNYETGQGDLTTESVSPYPIHSSGKLIMLANGVFSGREIIEQLFEDYSDQLNLDWRKEEGAEIQGNDIIFEFEGNGAIVLNYSRIIEWIVGRMSGIAGATREAVNFFNKVGKSLNASHSVFSMCREFDDLAFQTGGGIVNSTPFSDRMYIAQNHISYSGEISKVIKNVNQELNDAREVIKIEVEVNSYEEFVEANKNDIDRIHLVNMSKQGIRDVFEKGNPNKKPILHLRDMNEWQEEYRDYFFRHCTVGNLIQNSKDVECKIYFDNDGTKELKK